MSDRPNLFKSELGSDSKSKYKTAQELNDLIRNSKRDAYPGIPQLEDEMIVEDSQGPCIIDPDGMDWLELSLLVMNKIVTIPGATRKQLAELRIYIPDTQNMH